MHAHRRGVTTGGLERQGHRGQPAYPFAPKGLERRGVWVRAALLPPTKGASPFPSQKPKYPSVGVTARVFPTIRGSCTSARAPGPKERAQNSDVWVDPSPVAPESAPSVLFTKGASFFLASGIFSCVLERGPPSMTMGSGELLGRLFVGALMGLGEISGQDASERKRGRQSAATCRWVDASRRQTLKTGDWLQVGWIFIGCTFAWRYFSSQHDAARQRSSRKPAGQVA
ncbi:uncharacterized protein AB9W97_009464 isoform 1-T1 [Spinachia spinachia]